MSRKINNSQFTLGIEEEYLLVDSDSGELVADPPEALFKHCAKALPKRVTHEFLRAQIEVGTPVCDNLTQARQHLHHLRQTVSEIASHYDLAIIAASSHPRAHWSDQQHTRLSRYDLLEKNLQAVVRRLVTCGMHVHVGIADQDQRIDLMNQCAYFLPQLLALSSSSPFWEGDNTGLKSYRLAVFNELPRTGLPDHFHSWSDYQRHVNVLIKAGLIKDASMLWWDIRPSCRYPTLEMRITDVCTHLDDALCIAALYQATLKMLSNLRENNQRWREYSPMLILENRWLAQRYGIDADMIDFRLEQKVAFAELLNKWLELIDQAAVELGCEAEVRHARNILQQGTSADRQLAVYRRAQDEGADHQQALLQVTDWLIAATTSTSTTSTAE